MTDIEKIKLLLHHQIHTDVCIMVKANFPRRSDGQLVERWEDVSDYDDEALIKLINTQKR